MKAIVFNKAGEASDVLNIVETTVEELQPGQVKIKVKACPINPSDYMFIKNQYRINPNYPQIAGLEASGIVVEVHKTVIAFKKDDHVAFRIAGTWTEIVNVNEDDLLKVPLGIPFEISCQIALNAVTAYALLELSKCEAKSYLLLSAATSSVASLIVQMAKAKNIKTICLVRNMESLPILLAQGAFAVINGHDQEIEMSVMELTENEGISAFLDAVGGNLLSRIVKIMRNKGEIILYGRYSSDASVLFNSDVIYKNLTITGFGIGEWLASKTKEEKEVVFSTIFEMVTNKMLLLPPTFIYDMKDIAKAIIFDKSKKVGKVVLLG